jgi:mono/diheme cytochrome c family protein
MDARTHQVIGWIYFIAAWLSLFVINGIIGFMLTPGDWMVDGDFWSGFFNPSFWPSLFFRTFISLMLAGVYAFLSTAGLKDPGLKFTMTRYSAKWVLFSFLSAVPSGYWYLSILPNQARSLVEGASPTIQKAINYGTYSVIFLIAGTLILLLVKPSFHSRPVSLFVLVCAFIFLGSFEWTREASRRPFVVNEVLYSNSISPKDLDDINREGFLHSAKWVSTRDVRDNNLLQAGLDIFRNQCYACHSVRGADNDIVARTSSMDYPTLFNYIGKIHQIRYFMPPFAGNDSERKALAFYIIKGIQGKTVTFAEERHAAMEKGEELFEAHCTICHPKELVQERTAGWDRQKIRWALDNLNRLRSAMPDYGGTPEEKDHVADYIFSMRGGRETHDDGKEVFQENCAMCHSLSGGSNPLLPKMGGWRRERIRGALDMLDKLKGGMPPLRASGREKDALTAFLLRSMRGGAK